MLASFSLLTRASLVLSSERCDSCSSSTRLAQLLYRVGQAHLDLGEALPDGHGVVAAGVVAAGAAVELVGGVVLVHAREDLAQLLRRWACRRSAGRRARRCARGRRRRLAPWRRPRPLRRSWRGAWRASRLTCERRLNTGSLVAEAGAHDAALAAEDVQQARLGVAVLEVGDRLDEVAAPVGAHDVAGQQVLAELGRLQHAAGDGEEAPRLPCGGSKSSSAAAAAARPGRAPPSMRAQLHVGEHRVHLAVELLVVRLALLGDAGPDEDDLEVGPVLGVQHAGRGDHGRDDGRQPVEQVGMVLAHVADHRRAGGGDPAAVAVRASSRAYSAATRSAPNADLVHAVRSRARAGRATRPAVSRLRELGRVARRHDGGHRRGAGEQRLRVLDAAEHLLGVLAAHGDAVAAADAARLDDAGLAVEDLDGLGRALAHARVAAPAASRRWS